jgi:hypothetical protein
MPAPSATSPLPPAVFMPQQSMAPEVTPSPVPKSNSSTEHTSEGNSGSDPKASKPLPKDFPLPKLRLEIQDLLHAGTSDFIRSQPADTALKTAVQTVVRTLYSSPSDPFTNCPDTRSISLILRDMDTLAYTTGWALDDSHKEIHFSLRYIAGVDKGRKGHEILGVLTHEVVHCYQHNAHGTCPGGLIEGIADFVRLKADLGPPHWKKEWEGKKWDSGYQITAYFLEYLEGRYGEGTVRRLNEALRKGKYEEKGFWTGLLGRTVQGLWDDYGTAFKKEREEEELVVVEKDDVESTGDSNGKAGRAYAELATRTIKEADDEMVEGEDKVPAGVV